MLLYWVVDACIASVYSVCLSLSPPATGSALHTFQLRTKWRSKWEAWTVFDFVAFAVSAVALILHMVAGPDAGESMFMSE